MIKNNLTIAARHLWKNKRFTAINIFGLAIGISASLVIYLLVNYHFSFDKFEKDGGRIYRVVTNLEFAGEPYRNSGVTVPMGPAMQDELTGLDIVAPFHTWFDDISVTPIDRDKKDPVVFKKQKEIIYADENFFNLIGYTWLAGSVKTAFKEPFQAVLTESNAKRYFPKHQPAEIIGKELIFNDTIRTTVTGVVKDIEANTDFSFKTFVSKVTLETKRMKPSGWEEWNNTNSSSQLLVKLSPGAEVAKIEKSIFDLYSKHRSKDEDDNSSTQFILQPLKDLHFNPEYGGYSKPLAHKPTLYGLLAVAAFLLLLGCINFINLTTAQAAERAKEIGIRKTMGSSRKQLIFQFLGETFLLSFSAMLLSVLLAPLLLNAFSGFIPDDLRFDIIRQPGVVMFLLLLTLVVTLLSGFYPAIVLSAFKPVSVLKNQAYAHTGKTRSAWLRKSLTVSQFVIAQVFIMAAVLVSKQITYAINKDQGFKKEAIVYLNTNYFDSNPQNKYVLMNKIKAIPEVALVSLCNSPPSSSSSWSGTMKYKDGEKEIETNVQMKYGDTNYLKLYGLKLLAGENLQQSDTANAFIINETYARILGFQQPGQAVGKYIDWSEEQFRIRGVVADFNQTSLRSPIKPLIIANMSGSSHNISIALQPQNESGTTWKTALDKIEKVWKEIYPNEDFTYNFFDEDIAKYYKAEQNISSLLRWATGLAIFISCLGLLGLVIHTTNTRTKEIGVRKVLGASVTQIVGLIAKDFIGLVLLAFVIAAPLAWIGMQKWLENFAYRTDISWWVFLAGVSVILIAALLTLAFQTIKAALANPAVSLKNE